MAKTASDTLSASAEEALKRRKKQARQEAKLALEIEQANKDLKKAQKKQSKAQARLQARTVALRTLEGKLEELHAQSLEPAIEATPHSAELESQQEPSELESSMVRSDGQQLPSPDQQDQGEISSLADQVIASPHVEEAMVVTNEVTEASEEPEAAEAQDNESITATETEPTQTTPRKTPAQKTAATRKPTATKRPSSRSQSTRQSPSDSG